jgi:membrane protein
MWKWFWHLLDGLFFGPVSQRRRPLGAILRLLRYPYAVLRDLSRGEINLWAMGLVFTTLLTLIPLLAFAFAILKAFGGHRRYLEPIVFDFLSPVGASAQELTERVMQFADGVRSGIVGTVGFALLAWTLLGTLRKVEDSFNFLWRVEHARGFARRVVEYLGLLIVGPIVLVGFFALSEAALKSEPVQIVTGLPLARRLMSASILIAPYVIVTLFFTLLYMFIPNTRVRLRPALVGAVSAGVLWAAVGRMFTALVVSSTRLTLVYAGFAVIIAVLTWIYFGWLILLTGAQLSFYVQNPSYLRLGLTELKLSSADRERLALRLMYLIGAAHLHGEKRWRIDALASALGVPGIAVSRTAAGLERAGLLRVTAHEELVPGRDLALIRVSEILGVVRHQESGQLPPPHVAIPAVERLATRLDAAWRQSCNESLLDLLHERGDVVTLAGE